MQLKLKHINKTSMSSNVLFNHSDKQFSLLGFFQSIISDCGLEVGKRPSKTEEKINTRENSINIEFQRHKIKLLNKIVAFICILRLLSGIAVLFSESPKTAIIPLCFIPIFLLSSYFVYIDRVKLAFSYFVFSQFIIITIFIFIVHSNLGLSYYYLITPIIAFIFLEDRTVLRRVLIISSVVLFALSQYVYTNNEPLFQSKHPAFAQVLIFITCFTIVYFLLKFYWAEIKAYRKKANDMLNELNTKNVNLKNFNQIAAHDLKEPLNTISGFTSLVEKRLYKKDCIGDLEIESLLQIKAASNRMKHLLDDLMAYSLSEYSTSENEQVELNTILTDAQKNLFATIEKTNAKVKVGNLPVINANRNFMTQLFQNLIANSIKFQPKGKNNASEQSPLIEITAAKNEQCEYVYIKDNGIGIPKDKLQSIFEPFKRLNSKYAGTGLGLATCKNIVKQFDGKISIDSELGVGTTFTLCFPSIQ